MIGRGHAGNREKDQWWSAHCGAATMNQQ
jgi:hypothetical protein